MGKALEKIDKIIAERIARGKGNIPNDYQFEVWLFGAYAAVVIALEDIAKAIREK